MLLLGRRVIALAATVAGTGVAQGLPFVMPMRTGLRAAVGAQTTGH